MRRLVLREAAKRFPWLANVTLYGGLFAGGDLAHQLLAHKERLDWTHTRNVAVVAVTFHGNLNYFWMRALERRFPGKSAGMLFRKLLLDQSFASPLATSVFYTGVSFLEGKEDVLEDWREKFFNTWKTGLMYWPFMQFLNFALLPLHMRTAFMGCCAFLWATFLCFSRQDGDGTAGVALAFIVDPRKTLEEMRQARLARKQDRGTPEDN
ncbi:mpv17-like protein isoform X1 [Phyllopteryx taeniolatus]|uniref:mpv17-like protein isoform X1 n=1 Tax=Phyllopteryx taeniolatus TaxID=161469 RepID=UPI002AD34542|nr:mpv17-like protein isoform X1 [Phyllopteryx taeniolatus]